MEEPRKTLEELKALRVIDLRKMLSELGLPGSGMRNIPIITYFHKKPTSNPNFNDFFELMTFLKFVVKANVSLETNF